MSEPRESIQTLIGSATTKAGAGVAVYGGFTANEIAAFGGLAVAVLGLIYNIWSKERMIRIQKELAERKQDTMD